MIVNVTRTRWITVSTLKEASDVVRKHLGTGARSISSSRWTGSGVVMDGENPVARISYNGRVWTPEPWPACSEIEIA